MSHKVLEEGEQRDVHCPYLCGESHFMGPTQSSSDIC